MVLNFSETSFHVETQKYDEKLVALGKIRKPKHFSSLEKKEEPYSYQNFPIHIPLLLPLEKIFLSPILLFVLRRGTGTLKSLAFHFTGSGISQTIKNVTLLSSQGDEQTTTVSSSGDFVLCLILHLHQEKHSLTP